MADEVKPAKKKPGRPKGSGGKKRGPKKGSKGSGFEALVLKIMKDNLSPLAFKK